MARQIFVLNIVQTTVSLEVYGVFWLACPANLVRPQPGFTSQVPPVTAVSWGVTAAEAAALQAGTVVEQSYDTGQQSSSVTLLQAEAFLLNLFNTAQAAMNARPAPVAKFVGGFLDSVGGWTFPP